jgi:hypothetical protein
MNQTPELLIHSRTSSPHRLKTLNSLLHRLHTALRYSRLQYHPSLRPQKTLCRHLRYRTRQAPTLESCIKGVTYISCVCKLRSVIVINHPNAQCLMPNPTYRHLPAPHKAILPITILTPKSPCPCPCPSPPPPHPHHTTHKSHTPHTDYTASLNQPISLMHSINTLTHTSRTP